VTQAAHKGNRLDQQRKRSAPPRDEDDGFGDSRGTKSQRKCLSLGAILAMSNKSHFDPLLSLGKLTEDGHPIFHIDELNIGRGGGNLLLLDVLVSLINKKKQKQKIVLLIVSAVFKDMLRNALGLLMIVSLIQHMM
jgi:hypothetical protein